MRFLHCFLLAAALVANGDALAGPAFPGAGGNYNGLSIPAADDDVFIAGRGALRESGPEALPERCHEGSPLPRGSTRHALRAGVEIEGAGAEKAGEGLAARAREIHREAARRAD